MWVARQALYDSRSIFFPEIWEVHVKFSAKLEAQRFCVLLPLEAGEQGELDVG